VETDQFARVHRTQTARRSSQAAVIEAREDELERPPVWEGKNARHS